MSAREDRSQFVLGRRLTARNNDPEKVAQKVVAPKVVRLGPGVADTKDEVIECRSAIVEEQAVHLSYAYQSLQRVTERVSERNHGCDYEADGTPEELQDQSIH